MRVEAHLAQNAGRRQGLGGAGADLSARRPLSTMPRNACRQRHPPARRLPLEREAALGEATMLARRRASSPPRRAPPSSAPCALDGADAKARYYPRPGQGAGRRQGRRHGRLARRSARAEPAGLRRRRLPRPRDRPSRSRGRRRRAPAPRRSRPPQTMAPADRDRDDPRHGRGARRAAAGRRRQRGGLAASWFAPGAFWARRTRPWPRPPRPARRWRARPTRSRALDDLTKSLGLPG